MSETAADMVYQGFWIDWSKGRVLGATITTTSVSGNLIIAFLAIMVSLATDHLWNLILFALHQSGAAKSKDDAVFQQRQVLIRTLPTPFLLLSDVLKMGYAWRKADGSGSRRNTMVVGLLVLVFGAGSFVASVFSSYIVSLSNTPVLVKVDQCVAQIDLLAYSQGDYLPNWTGDLMYAGQSYARNCYLQYEGTPTGCNIYSQPMVNVSWEYSSCPFADSDLCVATDSASIVYDSGLVDSNDALGINQSPESRVQFRRRTTYTPISVKEYWGTMNSSMAPNFTHNGKLAPEEELWTFSYGAASHIPFYQENNLTFWVDSLVSNVSNSYRLSSIVHYPSGQLGSQFTPISELVTLDADLALCIVNTNAVVSETPIDDPVFSAHHEQYCLDFSTNCSRASYPGAETAIYAPDYPVGVIVAQQQYQACAIDKSGTEQCTNLTGSLPGRIDELLPTINDAQRTNLNFLTSLAPIVDLSTLRYWPNLRIASDVHYGVTTGINVDQWMTESFFWEMIFWATIQAGVASRSLGFNSNAKKLAMLPPTDKTQNEFCASQKVMKSGGFSNVNVFGLSFVVAISTLVILMDVFVLKIAIHLSWTRRFFNRRIRRWIQDGVLQLQRRTYEADGIGPWQHHNDEVPIILQYKDLPSYFGDDGKEQTLAAGPCGDSETGASVQTVRFEQDPKSCMVSSAEASSQTQLPRSRESSESSPYSFSWSYEPVQETQALEIGHEHTAWRQKLHLPKRHT